MCACVRVGGGGVGSGGSGLTYGAPVFENNRSRTTSAFYLSEPVSRYQSLGSIIAPGASAVETHPLLDSLSELPGLLGGRGRKLRGLLRSDRGELTEGRPALK